MRATSLHSAEITSFGWIIANSRSHRSTRSSMPTHPFKRHFFLFKPSPAPSFSFITSTQNLRIQLPSHTFQPTAFPHSTSTTTMAIVSTMRTRVDGADNPIPLVGEGARPKLRAAMGDALVMGRPQAYIDTPQMFNTEWIEACGGIMKPLGKLPSDLEMIIVGGGIAGVFQAFLALMAGIQRVQLFECRQEVGGRCRSIELGDQNIAEEGSMRFSPSEALLYLLAAAFGFGFKARFPDPGVEPTLIEDQGKCQYWNDPTKAPEGFEAINDAWHALLRDGCSINGERYAGVGELTSYLLSKDINIRMKVVPLFQKWIDFGKDKELEQGLREIFGPSNTTPPGGNTWSEEDLRKFGYGGVGSGGFGVFFEYCFLTIWRFMPNEWETDQASFVDIVGGKPKPTGIRNLVQRIACWCVERGLELHLNTSVTDVIRHEHADGHPTYTVLAKNHDGDVKVTCDEVFISVPHRVAAKMGLARIGDGQLFPTACCEAMQEVNMTDALKVFGLVPRHPHFDDPAYPRVLLTSRETMPQSYSLDYNDPEHIVVLLTYAWGKYAKLYDDIKGPMAIWEKMKAIIAEAVENSDYPNWADHLDPIGEILVKKWSEDPSALGAFTFLLPGQDKMCTEMMYAYTQGKGPYLIGAAFTPYDGWMEGALLSVLMNFSAMLKRRGELHEEHLAPVNILDKNTYRY